MEEIRGENAESRHVFEFNGHKVNKSHVAHRFRQYRKDAGLEDGVTFHSLRHTFATWLVQKGVSIFEVQKLLGHSDIKVTQIYSHLAASDLHGTVNRIGAGISDESRSDITGERTSDPDSPRAGA